MPRKRVAKGWIRLTPRYVVINLSRNTIFSILKEWDEIMKGEMSIQDSIHIKSWIKKMREKL